MGLRKTTYGTHSESEPLIKYSRDLDTDSMCVSFNYTNRGHDSESLMNFAQFSDGGASTSQAAESPIVYDQKDSSLRRGNNSRFIVGSSTDLLGEDNSGSHTAEAGMNNAETIDSRSDSVSNASGKSFESESRHV